VSIVRTLAVKDLVWAHVTETSRVEDRSSRKAERRAIVPSAGEAGWKDTVRAHGSLEETHAAGVSHIPELSTALVIGTKHKNLKRRKVRSSASI